MFTPDSNKTFSTDLSHVRPDVLSYSQKTIDLLNQTAFRFELVEGDLTHSIIHLDRTCPPIRTELKRHPFAICNDFDEPIIFALAGNYARGFLAYFKHARDSDHDTVVMTLRGFQHLFLNLTMSIHMDCKENGDVLVVLRNYDRSFTMSIVVSKVEGGYGIKNNSSGEFFQVSSEEVVEKLQEHVNLKMRCFEKTFK